MRYSWVSPLLLVLAAVCSVSSASPASLSRQKRTIGPVSLGRLNFIGTLDIIILTVLRVELETKVREVLQSRRRPPQRF